MRTKTPRVEIVVNGVVLHLPDTVVSVLPDASAFVHALAAKPGISMGTAIEYAKRVAYAKREGRHRKPLLSPYNVESTALKAYWRWIANSYEERIRPTIGTLRDYQHQLSMQDATRIRVGCLVPPYAGKKVIRVDPTKFPNHVSWVPADDQWTLHVPERADDVHDYRQPLVGDLPTDYTLKVWTLCQAELEAIAKCFYGAWGKEQNLAELASSLPLFGEPPLTDDEPVIRPDEKIAALVGRGAFLEHVTMRSRGSVTADPLVFIERLKTEKPRYVVIEVELLRRDPLVRDMVRAALVEAAPETVEDVALPAASPELVS